MRASLCGMEVTVKFKFCTNYFFLIKQSKIVCSFLFLDEKKFLVNWFGQYIPNTTHVMLCQAQHITGICPNARVEYPTHWVSALHRLSWTRLRAGMRHMWMAA